jgi:arsenite-transporting ATPase
LPCWAAQQGKKTLLASTNPVHSLSSLLGQNVFGKQTPVEGVPNLTAYEIDTHDTIEKIQERDPRENRLVPEICRYQDQGG